MLHLLLGPTACGKTDVAMALARIARDPIEVVSADSRQVYRGMTIGTAAPTEEERRRVPHHLVGVVDPGDTMSAGQYARAAWEVVRDARARGARPIVVGGAGLYVRALLGGLAGDLPHDASVRRALERDADEHGAPALHMRLAAVDPAAAARIAPRDRIRIIRALEVFTITGRAMTALQESAARRASHVEFRAAYIERTATDLGHRIALRAAAMLDAGLEDETARVLERYPAARLLLEKTVGYAEVLRGRAAGGRIARADVAAAIAQSTRQYARRQRIWFQKMPSLIRISVAADDAPDETARRVAQLWEGGDA
jgi:tRNA dimethylallyltransferase